MDLPDRRVAFCCRYESSDSMISSLSASAFLSTCVSPEDHGWLALWRAHCSRPASFERSSSACLRWRLSQEVMLVADCGCQSSIDVVAQITRPRSCDEKLDGERCCSGAVSADRNCLSRVSPRECKQTSTATRTGLAQMRHLTRCRAMGRAFWGSHGTVWPPSTSSESLYEASVVGCVVDGRWRWTPCRGIAAVCVRGRQEIMASEEHPADLSSEPGFVVEDFVCLQKYRPPLNFHTLIP